MDSFDERAKRNAEKVTKTHEFRRANIIQEEEDGPGQALFDYSTDDIHAKYHALRPETLFKF